MYIDLATLTRNQQQEQIHVWDSTSFVIWQQAVDTIDHAESDIAFTTTGDVVLLNGCQYLSLFSAKEGQMIWKQQFSTK
jgi:hypothetical protein